VCDHAHDSEMHDSEMHDSTLNLYAGILYRLPALFEPELVGTGQFSLMCRELFLDKMAQVLEPYPSLQSLYQCPNAQRMADILMQSCSSCHCSTLTDPDTGQYQHDVSCQSSSGVDLDKFVACLNQFITLECMDNSQLYNHQMDPKFRPYNQLPVITAVKLIGLAWIVRDRITHRAVGLGQSPICKALKGAREGSPLPLDLFVNEQLCSILDIKEEFPRWKSKKSVFSFCHFPFILSTAFKCDLLKIESLVQMRHELQDAFFRSMFGGLQMPYLVIEVRRDYIIRDAMIQLDRIKSQDLKKQLRVQFYQEEGVDEGGLQKEFFQLAIREILHPKYGMFLLNEDTNCYWFHPSQFSSVSFTTPSMDKDQDPVSLDEYRLIGKLIGLAVYNNIILDLRFPLVIFKRLLGANVGFEDLKQVDPLLHRGLVQLLELDEDDVEDIYQRTFILEQKRFDQGIIHELVPGGRDIVLTGKNRQEYVDSVVDYYLNTSIRQAMQALEHGFREVCMYTSLGLFQPEEFESLVCGNPQLDISALKLGACYEGGYTSNSPIIQDFWDIVTCELSCEDQKNLLCFITGSSRVPIGGPAKLHLVIMRQGPDSEQLPTSHTCYNIFLLPEYSRKEKLRVKLVTALQNAEGFGLI
jgi:hypothetical protein